MSIAYLNCARATQSAVGLFPRGAERSSGAQPSQHEFPHSLDAMKRVRRYLSGLRRLIRQDVTHPHPERPNLHQIGLLSRLTTAPGENAASAATAYFHRAFSTAGFLGSNQVAPVIADYARREPAWQRALLDEAQRYCRIGVPVYRCHTGPLEVGLDWSTIPKTKDRLYQLRPHRFGFIPRLAIAAACGADALPALLATLENWIAHVDKHGGGDAYFSNLVIIYRLIAVSCAAPFCAAMALNGNDIAAMVCLRLFQILAADIQYLQPRLGDSVANNHLLADRFAAWFLATCYRDLYQSADSEGLERIWLEELRRQFHADGTNFEQSVHYHELGCELAIAYLVTSLRGGKQLPESALSHIAKMLRFQAALADDLGHSFALGDTTEDALLPLDAASGWAGGAWQTIYRTLFDASFPDPAHEAIGAERAFWLLAGLPYPERLRSAVKAESVGTFVVFPDGGYVVFRDDRRRQRLVFRTGPRHGLAIHAGHAMSDLLSVHWRLGSRAVMEPAGTYSYITEPAQGKGPRSPRQYFRGPAASNGIVLQGHDPLGVPRGSFRGHDNGTRVVTSWRFLEGALGWAEGRLDEDGPLNGYRRGVLHVSGHGTLIYDRLPQLPTGAKVSCHWQLAPEAEVAIDGNGRVSIEVAGLSAFMCAGGDLAGLDCPKGQSDPPAGWISRSYGRLQPASQMIGRLASQGRNLAFLLGARDNDDALPSIAILASEQDSLLLDVEWGVRRGIACIGSLSCTKPSLPFDLEFEGALLWLDITGGACREIRALGLRRLRSSVLGMDLVAGVTPAPGHWRLLKDQGGIHEIDGQWIPRADE